MEIGHGPNWGCSAKEKKSARIRRHTDRLIMTSDLQYDSRVSLREERNCHRSQQFLSSLFLPWVASVLNPLYILV
jgi:hypothetical protein